MQINQCIIIGIIIVYFVAKIIRNVTYNNLKAEVLKNLGFSHWNVVSYFDEHVTVKSRQTLEKFDIHKFSVVPIIDNDGMFVSTISEGDILRYIKNTCNFDVKISEKVRINEIDIYRSYRPLPISTPMNEVVVLALEQNFIPIVDDRGAYIGIIKRKSIIDYLLSKISID